MALRAGDPVPRGCPGLEAKRGCTSHRHEECADKGEGWPSRMRPFFPVLSPEPFIQRFQKGWKGSVGELSPLALQMEKPRWQKWRQHSGSLGAPASARTAPAASACKLRFARCPLQGVSPSQIPLENRGAVI